MRNFNNIANIAILNTKDNKIILFLPLNKEEYDELKLEFTEYSLHYRGNIKRDELDKKLYKSHKIKFADILALGDTEIETRIANSHIENTHQSFNGEVRRMFKCFVNADWRDPQNRANVPYHEDGKCSWNCLMQKLHHPKFGIIFTIDEHDNIAIKHFNTSEL